MNSLLTKLEQGPSCTLLKACAFALLLSAYAEAHGQLAGAGGIPDRFETLAKLSLEDVLNREVTSVSKRPEKFFESPAAISLISGDDIRRSGARSFAEALRMAPGMHVASMDANTWALSSRGFSGFFSDKLLVLMDGRAVYSPLLSSVYWDMQSYLMEDIDRVEVIRGPGGSLWGANAVNGVINISSKDAKDTQGLYTELGGGTHERGFFGTRYGARIGENGYGRVYVEGAKHENNSGGVDEGELIKSGFRSDWHLDQNHFTFQGDYVYSASPFNVLFPNLENYTKYGPNIPLMRDVQRSAGGNVLFRFNHQFSEESDLAVQTYFDHSERKDFGTQKRVDTFDLDFKHRFPLPGRQNFMYGGGYRVLPDSIENGAWFYADPAHRTPQVFNAFVQDEIDLVEKRLRLTLGTKVEHNDYTHWETEPNARLTWLPTSRQTIWAAVSRAVQVPGRDYRDDVFPFTALTSVSPSIPAPPPFSGDVPILFGSEGPQGRNTVAQKLISYELGYRLQARENLSFDLATFYNFYDDFLIAQLAPEPIFRTKPFPYYYWDAPAGNGGKAETYGVELASEWRATGSWRLVGTYSLLKERLDDVTATYSVFTRGRDPIHQASLRSSMDLTQDLQFDAWLRYVDRLPAFHVSSYFDLDLRLAWRPGHKNLEIALVGQNLIEPRRMEFGGETYLITQTTEVARGGYLQVSYWW